jgi:hypothetical protein
MYQLQVRVVSGNNLPVGDLNGKEACGSTSSLPHRDLD